MDEGGAAEAPGQAEQLGITLAVIDDDAVGQQDLLGAGAKIVADGVDLCPVVLLEIENKARVGPAPLVDALVIVADCHIVAVGAGDLIDDAVLGKVKILEFIDHHHAAILLQAFQDIRMAHQQFPT